ncbi:hypothetical protein TWF106_005779 [Orbilia oligospora]|uniref:Zn(2)-C6 fungal-type domain-containing protein n=1 Tax=Orbilia oligospora TaxID=2813651 RepID=A0A7C8Q4H1_ORBOL|nr:hypothetical protein TWF106_005779 [Orbilia oligospora]
MQPTSVLVLTRSSHTEAANPAAEATKTSLLPLRKACDGCRRRKTRCDRKSPCNACKISCLKCEYLTVHQRRGPKRRRTGSTDSPEGGSPHPFNSENYVPTNESPSTSEAEISSPYSSFEAHGAASSTPPTETTSVNHQIHPQEDDPKTYYSFVSNTTDTFIAHCPVANSSPNTAHPTPVENLFLPGLTLVPPYSSANSQTDLLANATFSTFAPYVKLFVEHIYPIMPVFDRNKLVSDLEFRVDDPEPLSLEETAMFSALSAAVILQLNLTMEGEGTEPRGSQETALGPSVPEETQTRIMVGGQAAASFISKSLSIRQQSDFIETPTVNWILTSFFIFSYYGHLERHTSAWYYLREAISLSLELKLHIEEPFRRKDPGESQRRKRIFWLLFVTERGYAVQRRRAVTLQPSISLPLIFDSEDPCLLYGFVNLINLFKFVDSKFSYIWGDDNKLSTDGQPVGDSEALSSWLVSFQENISRVSVPLSESIETQRVDIMVTREWLHMVAWQMTVRLGLLKACDETKKNTFLHLKYPFLPAKDLVTVISGTQIKSLESHGIGMEQKISQVAICLTDVMACTCSGPQPDLNSLRQGGGYLRVFLGLLSKFRGQRSRYLEAVLSKALPFISNTLCKQPSPLGEPLTLRASGNETNPNAHNDDNACPGYILL